MLIEIDIDPKPGKDRVDLNITFLNEYGFPKGKSISLTYALDDFIDEEKTEETIKNAVEIATDMNDKAKEIVSKKSKVKQILSNLKLIS